MGVRIIVTIVNTEEKDDIVEVIRTVPDGGMLHERAVEVARQAVSIYNHHPALAF